MKESIFSVRCFRGLRILFCVCCAICLAEVLSLNGHILALLAAVGIWVFLCKAPLRHFTLFLFAGGLLLRVAIALILRPNVDSDFYNMYVAAKYVAGGGRNILDVNFSYFAMWAYQSFFIVWEAFWLRLWNSILCLVLVNAVLSAGLVCLLYRMARYWVSERTAQAAALLLTIFPFALVLHTLLSNQIPSAFFLTLGLWVLVCPDCARLGFWRFPLAGLCFQLGNLMRPEGVIVLVAVFAWAAFECFRHPREAKGMLLGLAALLTVYFLTFTGADIVFKVSGLNPHGLSNGDPNWKFVLGLNYEATGGYSSSDANRIFSHVDSDGLLTEEALAIQNALIRERLAVGPEKLLRLAIRKQHLLWGEDSLYLFRDNIRLQDIQVGPFDGVRLFACLQEFDRGLFFLAVALMFYGLWGKRWKEYPTAAYLPFFVFFASFCAFLPIEVQPRYAYLAQLYIFTAAAFGLDRIGSDRAAEKGPQTLTPQQKMEEDK